MYDRENVLAFLKEMEFSSIVSRVPVVDSPMRPQNLEAHQGTLIADSIVEVKGDYSGLATPPITSFAELNPMIPEYVTSSLAQAGIGLQNVGQHASLVKETSL